MNTQATDISVADIVVPSDRLRSVSDAAVADLVASIKDQGLLTPIVVRRDARGTFCLVAGEHRLRAFQELKRATIRAQVREVDDSDDAREADRLTEIDENYARGELSFGERCLFAKEKWLLIRRRFEEDGQLPKAAAGAATRELSLADSGQAIRTTQSRLKVADDIAKVAKWAGVDKRHLARSCIAGREQLRAAIAIIDKYGRKVVIEAGNVHDLLKKHVKDAAKGDDDVNIIKFKKSVDAELRRDELSAKRSKRGREQDAHLAQLAMIVARAAKNFGDACEEYAKGGDREKRNKRVKDRDLGWRTAETFRSNASGQKAGPEDYQPRVDA